MAEKSDKLNFIKIKNCPAKDCEENETTSPRKYLQDPRRTSTQNIQGTLETPQ